VLYKTLTPLEKRRLDKSIAVVSELSRKSRFSEINSYIVRERMRIILTLLCAEQPTRATIADCTDIVKDIWPFKIFRLRKLINGRQRTQ
jgi:hypothetical protein